MMAFIDDDGSLEEHRKDECRGPSSAMSLKPPHFQNGWGTSQSSYRAPVVHRKAECSVPQVNVNNNNNNYSSGNERVVAGAAAGGNVNNAGENGRFYVFVV